MRVLRFSRYQLALAGLAAALSLALFVPGAADARLLPKSEARLEAEIEAIDYSLTKPWASSSDIGRCVRKSRRRVDCSGEISGTDFKYCSKYSFRCYYDLNRCTFKVIVYAAGFTSVGRVTNKYCTSRRISD